jgi:hypothetical protein
MLAPLVFQLKVLTSKPFWQQNIGEDALSFLPYGYTCLAQFSNEAKAQKIIACFQDLHSTLSSNHRQIPYNQDCSWIKHWTMLCAYIFQLNGSNAHTGKAKKRPPSQCLEQKTKASGDTSTNIIPIVPAQVKPKKPRVVGQPSATGLQSIISSRCSSQTAKTINGKEHPPNVNVSSKVGNMPKNKSTIGPSMDKHIGDKRHIKDTNWAKLRLISTDELQNFVQSYLLIHRHDGVDILSELSPLEVYSADQLHDWKHCRLSGKPPLFSNKAPDKPSPASC